MAQKLVLSLLVLLSVGSLVAAGPGDVQSEQVLTLGELKQKNDIVIGTTTIMANPVMSGAINIANGLPPKLDVNITLKTVATNVDISMWSNSGNFACRNMRTQMRELGFEACKRDIQEATRAYLALRSDRTEAADKAYLKIGQQQFQDNDASPVYMGNLLLELNIDSLMTKIDDHCNLWIEHMGMKAEQACELDRRVTMKVVEGKYNGNYFIRNPAVVGGTFQTDYIDAAALTFASSCSYVGEVALKASNQGGDRCCLVTYDTGNDAISYLRPVVSAFCDAQTRSNVLLTWSIKARDFQVTPGIVESNGAFVLNGITIASANRCKGGSAYINATVTKLYGCGDIPNVDLDIVVSWTGIAVEVDQGTLDEVCSEETCNRDDLLQWLTDVQISSMVDAMWKTNNTFNNVTFFIQADSKIETDWALCPEKTPRTVSARIDLKKVLIGSLGDDPTAFVQRYFEDHRASHRFEWAGIAPRHNGDYTIYATAPAGFDREFGGSYNGTFVSIAKEKLFQLYNLAQPHKYLGGAVYPSDIKESDAWVNASIHCVV